MGYNVCICCIVKDEQKFIKEWVDYHLSIGISSIHIFEDYGSTRHDYIFNERKYDDKVFITQLDGNPYDIPDTHNSMTQRILYDTFLKWCKSGDVACDWCLFIDVDEFLMFECGWDLNRLCDEYRGMAGVWLCWKMMGANGLIKTPHSQKGVLETYTKECNRGNDDKWSIKSFVNVRNSDYFNTIHEIHGGVMTNGNTKLVHAKTNVLSYKKAWLNHYFTKSFEDYCERIFKRGNMSNNYRTFDDFFIQNKDMSDLKRLLIDSVRDFHAYNTMYLSYDMKVISGGNERKLKELKNKIK